MFGFVVHMGLWLSLSLSQISQDPASKPSSAWLAKKRVGLFSAVVSFSAVCSARENGWQCQREAPRPVRDCKRHLRGCKFILIITGSV